MELVSTNSSRNYSVIGRVKASTNPEVRSAVAMARKKLQEWSGMGLEGRCRAIRPFLRAAEKRSEEIARLISMETGRPIGSARSNVSEGIRYFNAYMDMAAEFLSPRVTFETAKEVHRVYREPWGVVACICPWNYPFKNVAWQCGQALIAGNTIVYKNSEENPMFAKLLSDLLSGSGFPEGVFNIVYGDGRVGRYLAGQDIDMISFTGSTRTGQVLARTAARKFIPILAELGGSTPCIVFDDAEVDSNIEYIYGMRFKNNGQSCDSVKRLIVHESRFNEVVSKLCRVVSRKKVGDALDEDTDLGPLVAKRQLDLLEAQVKDAIGKGAKAETGGARPKGLKGAYYLPTVLTNVSSDMRVWKEEVFGPVLPVVPFSTEDEAVRLANDTEYGLSAHIITEDRKRFARVAARLQAGSVAHNSVGYWNPFNPFGGYKKSGIGRTNGEMGFYAVTQPKLVSEEK